MRPAVPSDAMGIKIVSANLGHAITGTEASRELLEQWLQELAVADVDLLFLQEMPLADWWSAELSRAGWLLYEGGGPRYRCRSGIAVHGRLGRSDGVELSTSPYHGSYLAAARVTLESVGLVTCVSVHASPKELTPRYLDQWIWEPPPRRRGGPSDPPVWDSDHVLGTLAMTAREGPVLAAGDLNEARAWDTTHAGSWGEDWFSFACEAGLHDLTYIAWHEERPTYGRLQADHVLSTEHLVPFLGEARIGLPSGSDHESILVEFDL
jgi:endonuclease/exonuclease/phosphatase family metal-dependent hydrolase